MIKHILLSLALISAILIANDDPKAKTITCVVSGDEINKSELKDHDYSSYKDGKVYFCCGGCKMDFDEAPNKFATKANFQLVTSGQYVQTSCPITGDTPGHTHHGLEDVRKVTVDGMNVDLCCPGCLKKYNKSSDKFSLLFSDKAYKKGFVSASKMIEKSKAKNAKKTKAKKTKK